MLDKLGYQEYWKKQKDKIEVALLEYLKPNNGGFTNTVEEGMHYAVFGGGKRLRSILVLEGAKLAGLDETVVMPVACSIEMLHTYSLVHDDLPAMDDDELRRGRPTCHIKYDEATAILIGDALLTRAFEVITDAAKSPLLNVYSLIKVLKCLAYSAGSHGMVGGQELDLKAEKMNPEAVPLESLHQLKTGALLVYSMIAGAMLGNLEDGLINKLRIYAENMGMVFQITDDILDVVGDEMALGKPIGSDEKNHKTTYVSRYGIDGAREKANVYAEKAIEALKDFPGDTGFLLWLIAYLKERSK